MAQESQSTESIFDFFYIDTWKIKSFYAQLTGNGAITTFKNISNISDGRQLEASASIPLVANGKGGTNHTASLGSEHLYDASQTMPREMIDRLDELGYINREISPDLLGNLVLIEGSLGVMDVGVLKDVMDPAFEFMFNQLPAETGKLRAEKVQAKKNIEPLLKFIKNIPFALQARFFPKDTSLEVWMTLSRDEMIGSAHDLNFKHGDVMAGSWYVLGVLDAIPNGPDTRPEAVDIEAATRAITTLMKEQFGRSASAYGMTPIAIFRVIKPKIR